MEALDYIDFAILGIILLFTFRGFLNGFSKEFCSLLGIITGVVIASRYAKEAGEWAKANFFGFDSASANTFFGFIAIFLAIWIASLFISHLLVHLINSVFPKYINALLGGVFGAVKSYLILAIILFMGLQIKFIEPNKKSFVGKSFFYPYMEKIASKIIDMDLSPEGINKQINNLKEDLQDKIQDGLQNGLEGAKDALQDATKPDQPNQADSTNQDNII